MLAKDRIIKFLLIEKYNRSSNYMFEKKIVDGKITVRILLIGKSLVIKILGTDNIICSQNIFYGNKTNELCKKIKEFENVFNYFKFI